MVVSAVISASFRAPVSPSHRVRAGIRGSVRSVLRRQRTERTDPRIPARTRCEGDTGARKLAEMTAETTIVELPWWDLAEVADQDAKVFGPTAWTIRYYWSVKAQNGTAMFMARTAPAAGFGSGQPVDT